MKIGIELGPALPREQGVVIVLRGVLGSFFSEYPSQEAVLFCTRETATLFAELPAAVERVLLPEDQFFPLLDQRLARGDVTVLFRGYPSAAPLSIPAKRQIIFVPDLRHEFLWEYFRPDHFRNRQQTLSNQLAQ